MTPFKRKIGDRYDGRRLRTLDPFYKIIPYIMANRFDAQNFFEDKIEIENIEAYLKEKRSKGIRNIGMLHIIIAAMIRTISQKPGLNRFVAGQRIYARNEIFVSLALKKHINEGVIETTIKVKFEPQDTIFTVAEKLNKVIAENKKASTKNRADKLAKLVMLCPGLIVKFFVWLLRKLDYIGMMPRVINNVSPMHTSVFITDLGSLGIQPIYHHLYEFGTTSAFIAFGSKHTEKYINIDNQIEERRFINMKIVTDERTVDGFYYASAFKLFRRLLQHPERLEAPSEQVIEDIK